MKIKTINIKQGSAKTTSDIVKTDSLPLSNDSDSFLKKMMQMKISKKGLMKVLFVSLPIVLVLFVIGLILSSGVFNNHEKLNEEYVLITFLNSGNSNILHSQDNLLGYSEIPVPKNKTNPVNGNLVTDEKYGELLNKKAFMVTINNHPKARAQSGLSQADIVLEVLTEGGISRYVGLFYENEPEKIGPVRSIRRYMLDYIAEFDDPVILHEGGASFNDSDSVYVRETDALRDINQYGMKSMRSADSRYRDLKKASSSGYVHSLYTSYKLIEDEFERYHDNLGWERESNIEDPGNWKFPDAYDDRGNGGKLDITFLSTAKSISSSGFSYNKDTNTYDRFITGKEDYDLNNSQRISPSNVIIEWHNYRNANDGYGRIIIDMIGEGELEIYRDGKLIKGTWKKDSRESRTRYYDSNGVEIELNRGQIWKTIALKTGSNKISSVSYEEN